MMKSTSMIALSIVLSGCAHEVGLPDFYSAETEAKFGAAVRQNIAAQTVNPNAPTDGIPQASGARTALAQERYLEDDVEEPSTASTLRSATAGASKGSD